MSVPAFAVVGHPNKGKSSLVATLSQDDSVQISMVPGTTVKARVFPMKVDGEILYQLIDTPGFQRAHKALNWLKERETDIHLRADVVREFVETFKDGDLFQDECELLTPILNGAGILYVVDGSKPYGSEFEAEMEILRWTGQPCMALINLIGEGDYIEQWKKALSQFFQIVRVFNAVTADFDKHVELLKAFGQLNEQWRQPLERAVTHILNDRKDKIQQSSRLIAEMIDQCITLKLSRKLAENEPATAHEADLKTDYFNQLISKEQRCRKTIEKLYHYHHINRNETDFRLLDDNLFSEQSWSVFGLSQQELLMTGLAGGAAMGAAVDVAVGGASLLLGAGIGALIGGVGAMISYDKLANIEIMGLALGGKAIQIGPMKNRNFPYVLLGRALLHHQLIENRTHAMRDELVIEDNQGNTGASKIPNEIRKKLEASFTKLRDPDRSASVVDELSETVMICMTQVD